MPKDLKISRHNRASFLVHFATSPFVFQRRSAPSAAFAALSDRFHSAVQDDTEMKRAFANFQEHFSGVVLKQGDAARLAALEERGAGELGIEVASLPLAIGPGLTLMYDAALEILRSSDHPIEPTSIDAQIIRTVEHSLDSILPLIGATSVTALELALDNGGFRDRLRERASELETYLLPLPPSQEPCEHCELVITDASGNVVSRRCGSEAECAVLGGFVIIGVGVWLISELWDWLF